MNNLYLGVIVSLKNSFAVIDHYPPKIIWFLWLQGMENAPFVVSKCYQSWVKHNPDWQIVFLDETSVKSYFSAEYKQITKQAFSDILRINLLAQYGGVWVDATCFCTKPLDSWLPDYMHRGFFAFERPGPDRMISSWFIASAANNHITGTFKQLVLDYWNQNKGMTFIENSKWKFLNKCLRLLGTQTWFRPFVTRVLRIHPYFWFHYLFEKNYLEDNKVKQLWDDTPKISADIPHGLQFAGLFNPITEKVKVDIDHKVSPCYKLMWNYRAAELKEGTVMDYLLNISAV
ncbi:capsular polysaccharide synthesis protein [Mucilaginibacter lappiensis]|uniref:Capsular polysaccharide synthesis protein n=1 Tax=Mucilaginibacter lappiensis TaxID=354630 RepID=A0A841JCY8_9SPHI|nr:capsular polysaccharide synthesis protein [Mucilaginibacter lappiensis]MBB6128999.1 hypothetical protein [Mucilaginibacter lappiensis]